MGARFVRVPAEVINSGDLVGVPPRLPGRVLLAGPLYQVLYLAMEDAGVQDLLHQSPPVMNGVGETLAGWQGVVGSRVEEGDRRCWVGVDLPGQLQFVGV